MDGGLTDDLPNLDSYRRLFTEARDLTQTAREMGQKYRRYYDGKLDPFLVRTLRREKKPDFNINRVRPGIEGMVGVVERGKSDPIARPRTPQDQDASEVATQVLRYIDDENRWHQSKLKAFRNMLVEGTAACIVEVDAKLEVRKRRIRFEEFFYDPYSREPDFSDASYMGIAKWQYSDALVAAYPDARGHIELMAQSGDTGDATWADRPDHGLATTWVDSKRKRLLAVEMYRKYGDTWLKCVFVGSLKLEEGPSPYLDEDDQPCNPIEAISAYIDDENNRYGAVADMAGPQDEINTYRRKAAHLATFRQVQETDSVAAYADPDEVRREAAKPDGVIPPGYGIVANDKFAMDMALLQEAKSEIERVGPNPAILGRQGENQSGRASLIRQQAGMTEQAHLYSALEDWDERLEKQAWRRVRQFWKEPKFIRVTDDKNAFKFVQINEPVMGPPVPVIDPSTGMPQFDPATRQIVMQPQVLGVRNEVAKMGVDIIIDNTPDTANVAQEQYQGLIELAKVGALGPNPGPILLQASSLPKKRELLQQMEEATKQQQPDPKAEKAFEVEMATKMANIDKTGAQAEQARATAAKTAGEASSQEMQAQWLTAPQPQQPGF